MGVMTDAICPQPCCTFPLDVCMIALVQDVALPGVQDVALPGAQPTSTHRKLRSSSEEQLHQSSPPWRESSSHQPTTNAHLVSPVDSPIHKWVKLRAASH